MYDAYDHLSLYEILSNFYKKKNEYRPTNLTCYQHLQCNYTILSTYFDWNEICHGKIDCLTNEPSFGCEDVTCDNSILTSSCTTQRKHLLLDTMFSLRDNATSYHCYWSLFLIVLNVHARELSYCTGKNRNKTCSELIMDYSNNSRSF